MEKMTGWLLCYKEVTELIEAYTKMAMMPSTKAWFAVAHNLSALKIAKSQHDQIRERLLKPYITSEGGKMLYRFPDKATEIHISKELSERRIQVSMLLSAEMEDLPKPVRPIDALPLIVQGLIDYDYPDTAEHGTESNN